MKGHYCQEVAFLIAMNFLKYYQQSEDVRCGQFNVSKKMARKWGWFFSHTDTSIE
jgi:hypothetical protein